jgi:hypothetical protein
MEDVVVRLWLVSLLVFVGGAAAVIPLELVSIRVEFPLPSVEDWVVGNCCAGTRGMEGSVRTVRMRSSTDQDADRFNLRRLGSLSVK